MEALRDLQEELGGGVTLLSDADGRATAAFGMEDPNPLPARPKARAGTFHVDRDGVVRHRWLAHNYRKRPDAEEVLRALAR